MSSGCRSADFDAVSVTDADPSDSSIVSSPVFASIVPVPAINSLSELLINVMRRRSILPVTRTFTNPAMFFIGATVSAPSVWPTAGFCLWSNVFSTSGWVAGTMFRAWILPSAIIASMM